MKSIKLFWHNNWILTNTRNVRINISDQIKHVSVFWPREKLTVAKLRGLNPSPMQLPNIRTNQFQTIDNVRTVPRRVNQ